MRYCITMERTARIAKWFDADDHIAACEAGAKIFSETTDEEFEIGDVERDYAIACDNGCDVVTWG